MQLGKTIIFCFLLIGVVAGLKCFDCGSIDGKPAEFKDALIPMCGELNANSPRARPNCKSCSNFRGKTLNGGNLVLHACDECQEGELYEAKGILCGCNTDLCNDAYGVSPKLTAILLVSLAGVIGHFKM